MSTAEQPPEYVTVAFDSGVATVTIDHPPVNLLTIEVLRELSRAIRSLAVDDAARAVVLRSANPEWFMAHFDVAAIAEFPTDASPMTELTGFDRMCELLRTMPKPTIAEIRGRAGGGGSEIALACDMRFVTPDAVLNQPEVGLGILPGGGGTVRLPRLVGRGRALEAILGCEDIDAATAERWGWVNRVLAADEIAAFVDRLARRIASFPAHAVAAAKASVVAAEMGVGDQLLAETAAFDGTLAAAETRQRLGAFLASGGQTEQGERRLGDLVGELGEAPES